MGDLSRCLRLAHGQPGGDGFWAFGRDQMRAATQGADRAALVVAPQAVNQARDDEAQPQHQLNQDRPRRIGRGHRLVATIGAEQGIVIDALGLGLVWPGCAGGPAVLDASGGAFNGVDE